MTVDRVVMIASHPGSVARLAQPIARAGMAVEAWSPYGSRLGYSRYVRRHTDLAAEPHLRRQQLSRIAREVGPRDWVILGADEDIYEVSDAADADPTVLRLLPVDRHQSGLRNKTAMAATLDLLGVRQPRWTTASTREEVRAAAAAVGGRAMVKTARGAGGVGVSRVDSGAEPVELRGWPPYLVQEWIDGEAVSIDIVVVKGRVALAPYSEMVDTVAAYGPSLVRQYMPVMDPGLSADLDRMAAGFGGTWLANVTAMRRSDGTHAIVEVDVRPNAWHSYLGRIGLPMTQTLSAVRSGLEVAPQGPSATPHTRVVNVSRVLMIAIRDDPRRIRRLLEPSAAWRHMHRGDPEMTYREIRDFARWLVLTRAGRRPAPPARGSATSSPGIS